MRPSLRLCHRRGGAVRALRGPRRRSARERELGNIILRGRLQATGEQTAAILDLLAGMCAVITPSAEEVRHAAGLADDHRLTLYDATYAAVAHLRGAELATLEKALLTASLGRRPSEIVGMVQA